MLQDKIIKGAAGHVIHDLLYNQYHLIVDVLVVKKTGLHDSCRYTLGLVGEEGTIRYRVFHKHILEHLLTSGQVVKQWKVITLPTRDATAQKLAHTHSQGVR